EDQRMKLLDSAVRQMVTPRKQHYGSREPTTPLQDAFDHACANVMRDLVAERVKGDPEFVARIEGVVREAFDRALAKDVGGGESPRERMVSRLTEALVAAWRTERI
ncbi:MAG: hypothetical protein AAF368_20805, partial [Planctomycetota bacterium]